MKLPFVSKSTIKTVEAQILRDKLDRYLRLAKEMETEQPALNDHFLHMTANLDEETASHVILNMLDMYSMLKAQLEIESLES